MSLVVPLIAGIVTNVCFFMLSRLLRFSVASGILFIESEGRKKGMYFVYDMYIAYMYMVCIHILAEFVIFQESNIALLIEDTGTLVLDDKKTWPC